jgi:hypothetical protein
LMVSKIRVKPPHKSRISPENQKRAEYFKKI